MAPPHAMCHVCSRHGRRHRRIPMSGPTPQAFAPRTRARPGVSRLPCRACLRTATAAYRPPPRTTTAHLAVVVVVAAEVLLQLPGHAVLLVAHLRYGTDTVRIRAMQKLLFFCRCRRQRRRADPALATAGRAGGPTPFPAPPPRACTHARIHTPTHMQPSGTDPVTSGTVPALYRRTSHAPYLAVEREEHLFDVLGPLLEHLGQLLLIRWHACAFVCVCVGGGARRHAVWDVREPACVRTRAAYSVGHIGACRKMGAGGGGSDGRGRGVRRGTCTRARARMRALAVSCAGRPACTPPPLERPHPPPPAFPPPRFLASPFHSSPHLPLLRRLLVFRRRNLDLRQAKAHVMMSHVACQQMDEWICAKAQAGP